MHPTEPDFLQQFDQGVRLEQRADRPAHLCFLIVHQYSRQ
jgi:hypothetical protein